MRQRGVPRAAVSDWTRPTDGAARGGSNETGLGGIDVGKTHHWVCVVDADGKRLLSAKVANDEAEIVALIAAVTGSLASS